MKKHILFFILFFLIIQSAYSGWHSVMKDLQWMGGTYTAIAAENDRIFAASGPRDKIMVSTDKGKKWKATSGPIGIWVTSIIIKDTIIFASGDGGIYYTTDNGENWGVFFGTSEMVSGFATEGNNWYIGSVDNYAGEIIWTGVAVSHNNGLTWQRTELDSLFVRCIKIKGDSVFVGTSGGIYLSIDTGDTWEKTGLDSFDVQSIAVIDNVILAGVLDGGIYYSDNYGTSWENVGLNRMTPEIVTKGDTSFAGTIQGVYISTDKGYSWQQTNLNNASIHAITIDGDNIYVATSKGGAGLQMGIFVSTNNGQKWNKIGIKGGSNTISEVAIKDNIIFAGGRISDLKFSTDNGNSWQNCGVPFQMTNEVSSIEYDKDNIYLGTSRGLFISRDNGKSWEHRYSVISENPTMSSFVVKGDSIFAGESFGYGGIYLTTDWCQTWKQIFGLGYVFALGAKGDSILMGQWGGLYLLTDRKQPLDSGKEYWKRLISDPEIRCIKTDSKSIFAAGKNGLYKSIEGGEMWEKIEQFGSVQAIAIDGQNIAVGAAAEVYLSTDYGLTWQKTGLYDPHRVPLCESNDVRTLAINADTIFAATYSGLYRYIIGDTSTVEDTIETHITQTMTISPPLIFPNPARDYIYINSTIKDGAEGVWQYQIYDILGNCVQSGTIESNKINISQLSSGFYTVRFFNGSKQVVEKLMKE